MRRRPPRSTLFPCATLFRSRLVPHFNALWGVARRTEAAALSADARAVLKVLRREWEMATCDLREASKVTERPRRSEEHTSELQSRQYLVCRLLLEKKNCVHS